MVLGSGSSRRIALILRPFCSKRATICPTRPRATASGLIMTKVDSRATSPPTCGGYLSNGGGKNWRESRRRERGEKGLFHALRVAAGGEGPAGQAAQGVLDDFRGQDDDR